MPRSGREPTRSLPQRTCVVCRRVRAKKELVRVVRSPAGELTVDLRGKASGRGAYVCPDGTCLERGVAELAKALEVEIPPDVAARLSGQLEDARQVRSVANA